MSEYPLEDSTRCSIGYAVVSDDDSIAFASAPRGQTLGEALAPLLRRPPLIFFHGFNNGDADIQSRAVIMQRLFPGRTIIVVQRPSAEKFLCYPHDEQNAETFMMPLAILLVHFALVQSQTKILISLVAHSLGCRLLMKC